MVYLFIIWWAGEITVADSTDKQLVVSLKSSPVLEDTTGLSTQPPTGLNLGLL